MNVAGKYIELILRIINTLCHTGCGYLLICQYKRDRKGVQQLLMINLCANELVMNLLGIFYTPPELFVSLKDESKETSDVFRSYVLVCGATGIYYSYYLSMIFITFDRLLGIRLHIQYRVYVPFRLVKGILITSWVSCITISIIFMFLRRFLPLVIQNYFHSEMYLELVLNFSFLSLAAVTYIFMFNAFRTSYVKRNNRTNPTERKAKESVATAFMSSRFYITVLIILTYIIFTVIPNLIFIFHSGKLSELTVVLFNISYRLSDLSDAIIYVFLQKSVREIFWRKLNCRDVEVRASRSSTAAIISDSPKPPQERVESNLLWVSRPIWNIL